MFSPHCCDFALTSASVLDSCSIELKILRAFCLLNLALGFFFLLMDFLDLAVRDLKAVSSLTFNPNFALLQQGHHSRSTKLFLMSS